MATQQHPAFDPNQPIVAAELPRISGVRKDYCAGVQNAEITLLQGYLPSQLSDAELDALIGEAVTSTGAASIKDMGKVMAVIKAKAQGRADMAAVGAKIKAKLGGCPTVAVP